MNAEERARMNDLVRQIQTESDHAKFIQLVEELNDLIAEKEHRFPPEKPTTP